jgi:hypothetical protein
MAKATFFQLVNTGTTRSITAVVDGQVYQADDTHPGFNAIVEAIQNNADVNADLFSPPRAVHKALSSVTDRISFDGLNLYFDGDKVDNSISRALVRGLQNGEDVTPIALFMERLAQNPNRHSRTQTFDWLMAQEEEGGFTIDRDGFLIGYKGVARDGDKYSSISTGTAFVDGVEHKGSIPNAVGSVVHMPRSKVQHDPSNGCSVGLHVGTWSYASQWARGAVLKVRVNPRDIVSVPTDCSHQKMRVSKYSVLEVLSGPVNSLVDDSEYEYDFYEDEDEFGNIW